MTQPDRHLDDALYAQIGADPESVPGAVCNHLRADCPACQAYLTALPASQQDRRIARLLREPDAPALPSFSLTPLARDRRGPSLGTFFMGLVGLIVAAGVVESWLILRTTRMQNEMKDFAPVRLRVSVLHPDGRLEEAQPGASYAQKDVLTAQLETGRETFVSLVRAGDGQGFEAIRLNEKVPGGTHTLTLEDDQKPAAVPLDGLSGSQHLVAVTCDRPIVVDEAISIAKGLPQAGMGHDEFPFRVGR
jgi:hypothetical protein